MSDPWTEVDREEVVLLTGDDQEIEDSDGNLLIATVDEEADFTWVVQ